MPRKNAIGNVDVKKLWAAAKEKAGSAGGDFIDSPMTGLFRLTDAGVNEIGENKWLNAFFRFVCEDEDSEYKGKVHIHRCGLENADRLVWLIRDLQRLGVDTDEVELDSMGELEDLLSTLKKRGIVIRAQLKGNADNDFLNMRIQRLVEIEEELEEEEEEETIDLKKMSREELKLFIKEQGLAIKVTKKMSDDDLRTLIAEQTVPFEEEDEEELPEEELEPEEEEEELDEPEDEEDEEEEDDEEDEVDLDEMSREELKNLIRVQALSVKVTKAMSDDDIRDAILEVMEQKEKGEEEEEDEEKIESSEFEEGDEVLVDYRRKMREGVVISVNKKSEKAIVHFAYNDKTIEVPLASVSLRS